MDEFSPKPKTEKLEETGWAFADLSRVVKPIVDETKESKEKLSLRILYAEDDPGLQGVTLIVLRRKGYVVDAVNDGEELLKKLENGKYDLIITDNNMPGKNGMEVLQEIKNNKKYENYEGIPIIVFSASNIENKVVLAGGKYLKKPASMDELYQAINEAVA